MQRLQFHVAFDTFGDLPTALVTLPTSRIERRSSSWQPLSRLVTGEPVELAYIDQGYTGEAAAEAAYAHGVALSVVKLPDAKRDFVLLPQRWIVERDYERLAATLAGYHFLAISCLSSTTLIT